MGARPNSVFGGVQIGAITYSFRSLPGSAEETLKYCVECGISAIELMSSPAESYAGAPQQVRRRPRPARPAATPPDAQRRRRPPMTPEQQEARRKAAQERTEWRLAASMDKYKEFRKMYEDAGVKIFAFKLPPTMAMPDEEYEYIWNVAETLGANHITMELPTDDALLIMDNTDLYFSRG